MLDATALSGGGVGDAATVYGLAAVFRQLDKGGRRVEATMFATPLLVVVVILFAFLLYYRCCAYVYVVLCFAGRSYVASDVSEPVL